MTNQVATVAEMVAAVKRYARDNYNSKGWDIIVECFSDEEIAKHLGKARTANGAIWKIWEIVKVHHSIRLDQQGW